MLIVFYLFLTNDLVEIEWWKQFVQQILRFINNQYTDYGYYRFQIKHKFHAWNNHIASTWMLSS